MAKIPIERQLAAVIEVADRATDAEAAQAAIRTLEFARDNRRHFELAAIISKDEVVKIVEQEFPGAKLVKVRRIIDEYGERDDE